MSLPQRLKILCFGDSLTEGLSQYGMMFTPYSDTLLEILEQKLNGDAMEKKWDIQIDNEGISGDLVSNMRQRIVSIYNNPEITTEPYDMMIFLGGTNDLATRRLPQDIFAGTKEIVKVSMESGARIVLITVPECQARTALLTERRDALNGSIKGFVKENGGVYLYDLNKEIQFHTMSAEERDEIWDDGLHFTPLGYERIGKGVAGVVMDILMGVLP